MTELDPELLGWVREFIYNRERVTVEDIRREFFPDEAEHPRLYLDKLKADRVIGYYTSSGEYHWAYKPEKKARVSHRGCTHANTAAERDRCRREQGKYSASQSARVESYRLDQEIRAEQEGVGEVPRNVLEYVTREFQAGVEGKRDQLPTTYDVAMACIPGAEDAKTSCRLARRYLRILESSGKIICVRDEEEARDAWVIPYESTFWALPDSGRQIPVAVTVSGLTAPLNRYGFTAEEWAAMKPWQRNSIRSIEMAETVPCVWGNEPK